MDATVTAIVPAAGLGRRFGEGRNKSLAMLLGKPLLVWTLRALDAVAEIREIIPVLKEQDLESGSELIEEYAVSKVRRIAPGGKERQDSIYNALKLVDYRDGLVLIHDGVRPLVSESVIRSVIGALDGHEGAVAAVPVKDTIKEAEGGIIQRTLPRERLWAVQTPQVFSYATISAAYERAVSENYYATDDAALVERCNGRVRVVMGDYANIKITTPEDIAVAERLVQASGGRA